MTVSFYNYIHSFFQWIQSGINTGTHLFHLLDISLHSDTYFHHIPSVLRYKNCICFRKIKLQDFTNLSSRFLIFLYCLLVGYLILEKNQEIKNFSVYRNNLMQGALFFLKNNFLCFFKSHTVLKLIFFNPKKIWHISIIYFSAENF